MSRINCDKGTYFLPQCHARGPFFALALQLHKAEASEAKASVSASFSWSLLGITKASALASCFEKSKLRLQPRDLIKALASLRLRNLGLRTHVCQRLQIFAMFASEVSGILNSGFQQEC